MISLNKNCVSPEKSGFGWKNPYHQDRSEWFNGQSRPWNSSLNHLARIILNCAWSPFAFKGGHRSESNFISADFVALDFDTGKSLNWAKHTFEGFAAIIGTTKSHQILKSNKPPEDRFRVILKLSRQITDIDTLRMTLKYIIKRWGSDRACCDGARYFFPCKEIVYIGSEDGKTINPIAPLQKPRQSIPRCLPAGESKFRGNAVTKLLAGGGFIEGERNNVVFKAACSLLSQNSNFPVEDTFNFLAMRTNLDAREIEQIIKSASKKRGHI